MLDRLDQLTPHGVIAAGGAREWEGKDFMDETLTMPDQRQYQITNGAPRRVYGAKRTIERASHDLVIATSHGETAKDRAHALWFTDLRRGRLNVYGGLLRFIDHLRKRNVPLETALLIPAWLESYIRECWMDAPDEQNNGKRKVA